MLLRIRHETRLTYSDAVTETIFEVRMAPESDDDQTALRYQLRTAPKAPVTSYRDGFGNRVDLFNIASPYQELLIEATSFVRTHRRPVAERVDRISWPGDSGVAVEALEFLQMSPLVDSSTALDRFIAELPRMGGPLPDALHRLMSAVRERLRYEKRATTARTPLSEALALGRGVCQDLTHLFLGACRRLGVAARYVSGYVNHPGELATHAWCQVWAGEAIGWVDVDPTHGCFPGDDHVVTAVGRDYSDVSPNRGVYKGRAQESIAVAVTVEPIERLPLEWDLWPESAPPRTLAQSQSQWQSTRGATFRPNGRRRSSGPPRRVTGYHQQQGQQQQDTEPSDEPAAQDS